MLVGSVGARSEKAQLDRKAFSMQWLSIFGAGQRAPERTLTPCTSPALTMEAQWIGWQAVIRWRFWPRMAERCADQEQ